MVLPRRVELPTSPLPTGLRRRKPAPCMHFSSSAVIRLLRLHPTAAPVRANQDISRKHSPLHQDLRVIPPNPAAQRDNRLKRRDEVGTSGRTCPIARPQKSLDKGTWPSNTGRAGHQTKVPRASSTAMQTTTTLGGRATRRDDNPPCRQLRNMIISCSTQTQIGLDTCRTTQSSNYSSRQRGCDQMHNRLGSSIYMTSIGYIVRKQNAKN